MDPRDQASVVVLTIVTFVGACACLFFLCQWYKHRPGPEREVPRKRVQKTFSRFSQVDEELTVQVYRESVMLPVPSTDPASNLDNILHPAPVTVKSIRKQDGKQYLETHM